MTLYSFGFLIPLVLALLPVFIYKDVNKSRSLVIINWTIVFFLFIPAAVWISPANFGYLSLAVLSFFSVAFILSLIGLVLEIIDKKKKGENIANVIWSTSFLALIATGALLILIPPFNP